jgi:hypothetical protein
MSSKWDAVRMAAADPILGVAVAYNKDPLPLDRKVCKRGRGDAVSTYGVFLWRFDVPMYIYVYVYVYVYVHVYVSS